MTEQLYRRVKTQTKYSDGSYGRSYDVVYEPVDAVPVAKSIFLDLLARELDANSEEAVSPEYGGVTQFTMDPYEIAELCLKVIEENNIRLEV